MCVYVGVRVCVCACARVRLCVCTMVNAFVNQDGLMRLLHTSVGVGNNEALCYFTIQ